MRSTSVLPILAKKYLILAKNQASGRIIQNYRCNECGRRFNERSGTPMARMRTPAEVIALAMKVGYNQDNDRILTQIAKTLFRQEF
jgi:transposase-like protein